jgi:hypothetical protein
LAKALLKNPFGTLDEDLPRLILVFQHLTPLQAGQDLLQVFQAQFPSGGLEGGFLFFLYLEGFLVNPLLLVDALVDLLSEAAQGGPLL